MSLTGFGAAVYLPEYGVEGLIRREALGPDHWQFDEQSQCLIGRHTRAILRLGQTMRVRIVDVHPAAGQLDLAPAVDLIARLPQQTRPQQGQRKRSQRHRSRRRQ